MHPEVIVSLTTFPARIPTITQMLEPLFRQTVRADHVYLWLVRDEFDAAGVDLPDELMRLQEEVPEFMIRWVEGENLRPNNKWYWTMRESPDALTILVDDDLVYPLNLIEKLLDAHYLHPEAVIGSRSHLVTLEGDDIGTYPWEYEQRRFIDVPRHDLIATPGAGTLFPPHCLPEGAFDVEAIKRLAITADDLWLMAWTLMGGRPVVITGEPTIHNIEHTQDIRLCVANVDEGGHTQHLKDLYAAYPRFHELLLEAVRERLAQERAAEPKPPAPAPKRPLPVRLYHKAGRLYRKLREV